MAQGVGIEEIIDIQTEIQSGGTIRAEFGTGLLITKSDRISAGGPFKSLRFGSLASVADRFGSDNSVYRDAAVWFAADPAPKALYIGRWADALVKTKLEGGSLGITAPTAVHRQSGAEFRINGQDLTVDLSSPTTFAAMATLLQSAIRTGTNVGLPSATVTWNATAQRFDIDYGGVSTVGPVETSTSDTLADAKQAATFLRLAVTPSAPTTSATYLEGSNAEEFAAGVSKMVSIAVGGAPTALMLGTGLPDNIKDSLETYVQGGDFMSCRLEKDTANLAPNDTSSKLYQTFSNSRSKIIPIYSRGILHELGEKQDPRPDIAVLAKLSSQNFDLPLSIITLVPKPLPGAGTTDIDETQLQSLAAKQASVYTLVGGLPALLGGWTGKSGIFADSQWWILWLKNEMERSIYSAMRTSKRLSHAQLKDTINGVMAKAVNSGGAKPGGVVSDIIKNDIQRVTGNFDFDGRLTTGYLLWIDPPSEQTDADRAARISRFKVWVAPSEAIHSVGGAIILSG